MCVIAGYLSTVHCALVVWVMCSVCGLLGDSCNRVNALSDGFPEYCHSVDEASLIQHFFQSLADNLITSSILLLLSVCAMHRSS